MTTIGITTPKNLEVIQYERIIDKAGGSSEILQVKSSRRPADILEGIDGLLLTDGSNIDRNSYDNIHENDRSGSKRDIFGMSLIKLALKRDIPILGICRGMETINMVMGGTLVRDVQGHHSPNDIDSLFHDIYIAPGSRLGAIFAGSPIMRVNSRHHHGINQANKAAGLLASAYVLDGDLIEAIESPEHRWVIGVQWHPERQSENHPKNINLFYSLIDAASQNTNKVY